jgi:hypothetical protein
MAEMAARIKLFYNTATMEDMDRVDELTKVIMNKYSFDKQTASKKALQLFLIKNPGKYQSGGNYKKHKTLKRKHRKFTNKSKKHKRTRYHRKK